MFYRRNIVVHNYGFPDAKFIKETKFRGKKDEWLEIDEHYCCNNSCIAVTAIGIIVGKKMAMSFIFFHIDSSTKNVVLFLTFSIFERLFIGSYLSLLSNESDISCIDSFLFKSGSDKILE